MHGQNKIVVEIPDGVLTCSGIACLFDLIIDDDTLLTVVEYVKVCRWRGKK
jgi:hypothetical protein